MGVFIGGLYAVSGYFINEKSTAGAGYAVASLTSLALAGRMGHYYYKYITNIIIIQYLNNCIHRSGILVPRGLMAGVAAVAGIHNIKKYLQES